MSALPDQSPSRRRLLLASDRSDRSSELADILRSVGNVDTVATTEIPPFPNGRFSGVVVDINLRSRLPLLPFCRFAAVLVPSSPAALPPPLLPIPRLCGPTLLWPPSAASQT